ncbi:MAG: hypothetical protein JNK82_12240 [Myxococcaceae bacterium]|nr:hypothetical protein [Myxococcaceae bacterium]
MAAKRIDWKKVELVYEDDGSKVPSKLKALLGPKAPARGALSFFLTELVHQDALAPGAKTIAPLLVPIANDERCPIQGELFGLLGLLACGGSANALLFAKKDLPVDAALVRAAEGVRAEAISRIGESNVAARLGAAFLFATLRSGRDDLLVILRASLKRETDATVRATALFSLAIVGKGKVEADQTSFTAALAAKAPIERLAGVFGLARLGKLTVDARGELTRLLTSKDVARGFPWEMGNVAAVARRVAQGAGEAAAWLPLLESDVAHVAVGEVAPLLFPGRVADAAKLSDAQRRFLERVTQDAALFARVEGVLKKAGFPTLTIDVRRFAGLEVREPLDEAFSFDGSTRTLRELVTLASREPARREAISAVVTRGKSGAEVMAACVQCERVEDAARDADGTPARLRVQAALLHACRDDAGLLKELRTFDFYDSVQLADGRTVLIESLRVPIALELARRSKSGDEKRFKALSASAFDKQWSAPMWCEVLLALDGKRREALLEAALFDGFTGFFRLEGAYLPVLFATPSQKLAKEVISNIGKWQQLYRSRHHAWEVDGVDGSRLRKLAAKDHPRVKWLDEQTRQYVRVLREAKLEQAAVSVEKALAKFVATT